MRKALAVTAIAPLLATGVMAAPAHAEGVVDTQKLESKIEKGFKKQTKTTVDAKCPKRVTWVEGKVFYCKVYDQGSMGRIKVTLRSGVEAGRLSWKLV